MGYNEPEIGAGDYRVTSSVCQISLAKSVQVLSYLSLSHHVYPSNHQQNVSATLFLCHCR